MKTDCRSDFFPDHFNSKFQLSQSINRSKALISVDQNVTEYTVRSKIKKTIHQCNQCWLLQKYGTKDMIRYNTIRDAILTCARKPT